MFGSGHYGMGSYGDGSGWMNGMMLFGGVFWIVLLVLGIMAIMWVVRRSRHGDGYPRSERGPSSLEILEERYARGDLDRDEYLQKKSDILKRDAGG